MGNFSIKRTYELYSCELICNIIKQLNDSLEEINTDDGIFIGYEKLMFYLSG
ncbi:hypothetical protein CNEO2_60063 [Clostridium neonatale]|nr:hypothetical protein CNEO2_60063 [Clostridium neonatale]